MCMCFKSVKGTFIVSVLFLVLCSWALGYFSAFTSCVINVSSWSGFPVVFCSPFLIYLTSCFPSFVSPPSQRSPPGSIPPVSCSPSFCVTACVFPSALSVHPACSCLCFVGLIYLFFCLCVVDWVWILAPVHFGFVCLLLNFELTLSFTK